MTQIVHFTCFSCGLQKVKVEYQDWGPREEHLKAVEGSIRAEHSRISGHCLNPRILVLYGGKAIPFWKLERIVEGLRA